MLRLRTAVVTLALGASLLISWPSVVVLRAAEQYWYPGSGLSDTSFTSGPTASGWLPHQFCYGAKITVGGSAGTATVISARVDTGNEAGMDLKLGLYATSGNLLASGNIAVPQGSAGTWRDVTISAAVSPGDYFVLGSAATTNLRYYYNTTINGSTSGTDYAAAMADPETISDGTETNLGYAVRVFVVESGGAPTCPKTLGLLGVGCAP